MVIIHGYQLTFYTKGNNEKNCAGLSMFSRYSVVEKTQGYKSGGSEFEYTGKCIVRFFARILCCNGETE